MDGRSTHARTGATVNSPADCQSRHRVVRLHRYVIQIERTTNPSSFLAFLELSSRSAAGRRLELGGGHGRRRPPGTGTTQNPPLLPFLLSSSPLPLSLLRFVLFRLGGRKSVRGGAKFPLGIIRVRNARSPSCVVGTGLDGGGKSDPGAGLVACVRCHPWRRRNHTSRLVE